MLPPDVIFSGENAPNSTSAGAPPQTPLGELTALPKPPSWNSWDLLLTGGEQKGRRKDGKGRVAGEEGKGKERGGGREEGAPSPPTKILPTPLDRCGLRLRDAG